MPIDRRNGICWLITRTTVNNNRFIPDGMGETAAQIQFCCQEICTHKSYNCSNSTINDFSKMTVTYFLFYYCKVDFCLFIFHRRKMKKSFSMCIADVIIEQHHLFGIILLTNLSQHMKYIFLIPFRPRKCMKLRGRGIR
ncbi:hypothetical protein D3C81_1568900 [compost metagenome]